jgi:carbamoyl-phosphate synthase large subunit
MKRVLTEASGSLVASWLIKAIKDSKNIAVASDISRDCFGKFLADEYLQFPKNSYGKLWDIIEKEIVKNKIDIVIPSFDETLIGWAERKEYFKIKYNVDVVISDRDVIETFADKYKTYEFFIENNIPTPKTSLQSKYELIKPRVGRGGKGIFINKNNDLIDMKDKISQEFVKGDEYTIDCLIDHEGEPIYIVPRKRMNIKDGKSLNGQVVRNMLIIEYVKKIFKSIKFIGPINIQCFYDGINIYFIEINPRIAGGMALGLASTENWIHLIVNNILQNKKITDKKEIQYGLRMYRYYEEIFV